MPEDEKVEKRAQQQAIPECELGNFVPLQSACCFRRHRMLMTLIVGLHEDDNRCDSSLRGRWRPS